MAAEIGHGDLQHGNVIVSGGQLRLIDYDGMYVPALSGRQSHEIGHRNYQHPLRSEREFGPHVDHFSTWVVYTSLAALTVQPELWRAHGGGDECLLFRREDFEQPRRSRIFRTLEASSDARVRNLGGVFESVVLLPPDRVPSIDWVMTMAPAPPQPASVPPAAAAAPQGLVGRTAQVLYRARGAGVGNPADWLRDHVTLQPPPANGGTVNGGAVPGRDEEHTVSAGRRAEAKRGGQKATVRAPAAVEGRPVLKDGAPGEDPSWILDFIGAQRFGDVDFDGDLHEERAFVHRAMIVTVLTWIVVFWFSVPLVVPATATAVAAFVTLGVLANGYRKQCQRAGAAAGMAAAARGGPEGARAPPSSSSSCSASSGGRRVQPGGGGKRSHCGCSGARPPSRRNCSGTTRSCRRPWRASSAAAISRYRVRWTPSASWRRNMPATSHPWTTRSAGCGSWRRTNCSRR